MPKIFLIADEVLTLVVGAISGSVWLLGEAAGIPGMEYASFAGLLLMVLWWTQARISYLDKQNEEREKRQAEVVHQLQEFIHGKMHGAMVDLHNVLQAQCEATMAMANRLKEHEGE